MPDFIAQLEKKFVREKGKLFSRINRVTNKYRSSYNQLLHELNRLQGHESNLRKLERMTSLKVSSLRNKIKNMINRENNDKTKILQMTNEIKRLRVEIPKLHHTIVTSKTIKENFLEREKKLSGELDNLRNKIQREMSKKAKLGEKLRELTNKENLLKAGRIYWKALAKKAKVSKAAKKPKVQLPIKKKSLFNRLFR